MRSVSEAGLEEVQRLKRRIGRALGADAISQLDHDYLRARLDECETRIQEMEEVDNGMEITFHGTT